MTIDTHNSNEAQEIILSGENTSTPQRLYTIWLHLYNIFEIATF